MALTLLLALLILLILSAFFSGGETAVLTLRSRRLPVDPWLTPMQRQPLRFLSFILLGNDLVNTAISALTTSFILSTWGEPALALGTALLTIVLLIFGDILPKTAAASAVKQVVSWLAGPLSLLYRLFGPLAAFFSRIVEALLTLLWGHREESKPPLTAAEVAQAATEGVSQGILGQREEEILKGILGFSDRTAGEIMTPRTYMVALPLEASPTEAIETFRQQGLSRLPVYRRSLDIVVGVLYAKDLLRSQARSETKSILQLLRPAFAVPEGIHLDRLLADMRGKHTHLALVVDEYGGTSGVVTLEDVLEEILGDIWDEHDPLVFHHRRLRDGSWLLRADADRLELEELGIPLPEGFDNLAAWLLESSGRIPLKEDHFHLPGWHLTIIQATPQRVELVRASRV